MRIQCFALSLLLRGFVVGLISSAAHAGPTTTTTSTSLQFPPPCTIDQLVIDPDNTVDALARTAPTQVPFRVDSPTGGIWDLFLGDGGVGGTLECPNSGWVVCSPGIASGPGSMTFVFTYTPPVASPQSIVLSVRAAPHSFGSTCGPGSSEGSDSKEFPLAITTTTTTTITTTTAPPGTTTTTTLPQGWKVLLCHAGRRGMQRSVLVTSRRLSRHLDHGDFWGECPNSTRVALCHTSKKGKRRTLLVATRKIEKHISHGDSLGECSL